MKQIITISLFLLVTLIACTKSSTAKSSLIGKWKAIEYLSDPGNGSGTWIPVTDNSFIQFNSNSTYETSNVTTGNVVKFSLPNDSTIIFIYPNGTSTQNYKIESNRLTITGGCIEACGSKYIKQN